MVSSTCLSALLLNSQYTDGDYSGINIVTQSLQDVHRACDVHVLSCDTYTEKLRIRFTPD